MVEVSRVLQATPQEVFAILADGWSYAQWVVGTSHIRAVDAGWPKPGSRIHHSIGPWPLMIKDETVVRAMEPGQFVELEAKSRPVGSAYVRIRLDPVDGKTWVRMDEKFVSGPANHLPTAVQRVLFVPRNNETLRRLEALVEGRKLTGIRTDTEER